MDTSLLRRPCPCCNGRGEYRIIPEMLGATGLTLLRALAYLPEPQPTDSLPSVGKGPSTRAQALKRLWNWGLILGTDIGTPTAPRYLYRITPAGEELLSQVIADDFAPPLSTG